MRPLQLSDELIETAKQPGLPAREVNDVDSFVLSFFRCISVHLAAAVPIRVFNLYLRVSSAFVNAFKHHTKRTSPMQLAFYTRPTDQLTNVSCFMLPSPRTFRTGGILFSGVPVCEFMSLCVPKTL